MWRNECQVHLLKSPGQTALWKDISPPINPWAFPPTPLHRHPTPPPPFHPSLFHHPASGSKQLFLSPSEPHKLCLKQHVKTLLAGLVCCWREMPPPSHPARTCWRWDTRPPSLKGPFALGSDSWALPRPPSSPSAPPPPHSWTSGINECFKIDPCTTIGDNCTLICSFPSSQDKQRDVIVPVWIALGVHVTEEKSLGLSMPLLGGRLEKSLS